MKPKESPEFKAKKEDLLSRINRHKESLQRLTSRGNKPGGFSKQDVKERLIQWHTDGMNKLDYELNQLLQKGA